MVVVLRSVWYTSLNSKTDLKRLSLHLGSLMMLILIGCMSVVEIPFKNLETCDLLSTFAECRVKSLLYVIVLVQ